MCTPNVHIEEVPFKPETSVKDMSEEEYRQLQKQTTCRVSADSLHIVVSGCIQEAEQYLSPLSSS
jgi:hypothetical protein